jgi:hypothetical protein
VRAKVRIRFRKGGDLRLLSHHDLMTCFERMLRRAALPFRSTEGFNPRPRLVFALSLALGIVGADEVVELELGAELPAEEIQVRLSRQAPPGLEILSVRPVDRKTRTQVRCVTYRLPLNPGAAPQIEDRGSRIEDRERTDPRSSILDPQSSLPDRIPTLLAAPECWVERTRPQFRRFDLRPYLRGLRLAAGALEMDLWVTPHGTARPDEVLALLGVSGLLDAGAVLERTRLELVDEYPTTGDYPSSLLEARVEKIENRRSKIEDRERADPRSSILDPRSSSPSSGGGPGGEAPADGQPRSTPLIPGPLTFDS